MGRIVVVAAPERVGEWQEAPWLRDRGRVVDVVAGGPTRQVSVANGVRRLAELDPDGGDRTVLVHDGARPLASPALVDAVAAAVEAHGAALPVLPVAETLKRVEDGRVIETVDRATLARGPDATGSAPGAAAPRVGDVPARWRARVHRRGRAARGL